MMSGLRWPEKEVATLTLAEKLNKKILKKLNEIKLNENKVAGEGSSNAHTRGTLERLRRERRDLLNRMKEEVNNSSFPPLRYQIHPFKHYLSIINYPFPHYVL